MEPTLRSFFIHLITKMTASFSPSRPFVADRTIRHRLFFDVSILSEVKGSVTGISRVIVSTLRQTILDHPAYEVHGICFARDADGYRLMSLQDLSHLWTKLRQHVPLAKGHGTTPRELLPGDCVLLLGEQWLFPSALPRLRALHDKVGLRVVSLVHDLVPFFMPELYWEGFPEAYVKTITEMVELSSVVLVNSESTGRDLQRFFPALSTSPHKHVVRIRLGDSDLNHCSPQGLLGVQLAPRSFFLCVGTIQPRKNHSLLLHVWRHLLESEGDECPVLVIVGQRGWNVENLLYFIEHNASLRAKIRIFEQVSDAQLAWLYRNCLMTLYPSLYEGWGLPIAEALSFGKLCLASSASSMPEIAGDMIDYYSPHDSGALYNLILRYLREPALLRRRETVVEQHYRPTSWRETTQQLIQALELA